MIQDDIKDFLISGPAHFKNERWDIKTFVRLQYHDQQVDLRDANSLKIFDQTIQQWVDCSSDLSRVNFFDAHGLTIPVIDPHELMKCKTMLARGEKDTQDVEALRAYVDLNIQ